MPISGRMSLAFTSRGRQRGHAGVGIQEADAPQRRRSGRVGVEGVDAIVLRRHNHDIVNSIARHRDLRHVEWLRIDRTVNRKRVQFAEMCRVYVARSENGFADVLAGAGVVIVVSGHDGQTGGSQRFGGDALRMRRRIGRDQIVIRPGSACSSAGLAQLHRQQHYTNTGSHRQQLRTIARQGRNLLPIVQSEIDEYAEAETGHSQRRHRFRKY